MRLLCDMADVQAILPFPPNPLKHVLCDVPDCGVDVLLQFWHKEVREHLNEQLPGRWFGHAADTDNTFCIWPPRSPDVTVCDLFLWGFMKDNVYIPPLPKTLSELRERINTAIKSVTQNMLERVWREWEYRLDICRVT